MEANEAKNGVLIHQQGDYVVIRNGLESGIRLMERHVGRHPAIQAQDLDLMWQQHADMPVVIPQEQLPFELTPLQARVALCGIMRAQRLPESFKAQEARKLIGRRLEALLSPK